MLEHHPDIHDYLFKVRAQEYQQRAANYRLLIASGESPASLPKKLALIGERLCAIFHGLLTWQPRQTASRGC